MRVDSLMQRGEESSHAEGAQRTRRVSDCGRGGRPGDVDIEKGDQSPQGCDGRTVFLNCADSSSEMMKLGINVSGRRGEIRGRESLRFDRKGAPSLRLGTKIIVKVSVEVEFECCSTVRVVFRRRRVVRKLGHFEAWSRSEAATSCRSRSA